MLGEILAYLRNWFVIAVYNGEYTISSGGMTLPFLSSGQYYRIVGSIFNDGVYKYGDASELADETFTGAVWAMAVPPSVVALASEIETWQTANPGSAMVSESFAGYSYTKAADKSGAPLSWQGVFRARLNQWRKI